MKTLAIVGAGDLGQQIAYYALSDNHYQKIVFFDDFSAEKEIKNLPIIGKTADIEEAYQQNKFDELIIGIGYKYIDVRKQIFEQYNNKIPFATIIHSSSWIDNSATIKNAFVIYLKCKIDANKIIEEKKILNISCKKEKDKKNGKK
ncbi:MAG: hypothetical protein KDC60_07460, partial [Bacteroidetes bacterium]|nr:hypothetical protein [Bacteroidota bacterium]